jgi:F-type H+-transporting ATPase subunit epsilon
MDHRQIELTVITPERQVLAEKAMSVVIPAHDGELGILVDRAPLMCELGVGQLRYAGESGHSRRLFIDGGFAQVNRNKVTLLTTFAIPADEISPQMVSEARQAAEQARGSDDDSVASRDQAVRRASALRRARVGA